MPSARTGGFLIATGLAVPAITYFVALKALAIDAGLGGPPNQGAMVQAWFCMLGSLAIGVLMIVGGIFVLVRSRRIPGRGKGRD
ncbi:MAG: hypothetical protein BGO49_17685 [Planctomycetales bacterium 71-10]|nr:MAG: hypothetical protein BGO49_17685 [Planctomycetales bacterium 71-10]